MAITISGDKLKTVSFGGDPNETITFDQGPAVIQWGGTVGSDTLVSGSDSTDAATYSFPVVGLADGNFALVFYSLEDGENDGNLYFEIYDNAGSVVSSSVQILLNGTTADKFRDANAYHVDQMANGNLIISFDYYGSGGYPDLLTGEIYQLDGTHAFTIATLGAYGCVHYNSDVLGHSGGNIWITAIDAETSYQPRIWVRNTSGAEVTTFSIDTDIGFGDGRPYTQLAEVGNNNVVAVYRDGYNGDGRLKVYNSAGEFQHGNTFSANEPSWVAAVATSGNKILMVWNDSGVKARVYDAGTNTFDAVEYEVDSEAGAYHSLAKTSIGDIILTYSRTSKLYYATFPSTGLSVRRTPAEMDANSPGFCSVGAAGEYALCQYNKGSQQGPYLRIIS